MHSATRLTALAAATLCALVASPVAALDAEIGWTQVQGAAGYRLYVRQTGQTYGSGLDTGPLQSDVDGVIRYIYRDLPTGVTSHFAVTAYDASGGESARSNELALVEAAGCAATPEPGCLASAGSKLYLRGAGARSKLLWKWLKGTTAFADFGDPVNGSSNYRLCIYDEAAGVPGLKLGGNANAGGTCNGKACWKQSGSATRGGFKYRNSALTPEGLQLIKLKAGTGKARIIVKGKGANLPPTIAFGQDTNVTVQLLKSDGGVCWQAVYPAPAVKNSGDQFKDQTP